MGRTGRGWVVKKCDGYVTQIGEVGTDSERWASVGYGRTVAADWLTLGDGVGSNLGGSTKQNLGRIYTEGDKTRII